MTPNLRINLLGEFRLLVDEQPFTSVITRRQQALLAYLLLHRHAPQPRQYVAYQFWPDSAEGQAQTNLRKLFFELRKVLPSAESFLYADSQTLGWRPDAPFTLDVAELERVLERLEQTSTPDVAVVQQVVMLYQGHLMPACYEEWLLPMRRALHERVVNTLAQAITGLEAQHEFLVAMGAAEHLLRLDPLHEAAYRQLMHLHMLSGDRAGALRIYHECVTKLEQELEVSPAGETQALYQHLLKLDGETTPVLPTVTGQRHEHVPLVGRKQEWHLLQQAWSLMSSRRPQLITIWGEAGMGKTRLMEELLHWARMRPGTVAYARAYAAEGALAYGPLTEWLRSVALRPVLTQLEDLWQTELARILPELLTENTNLPPPAPMSESWQRQRFFEALARAVLAAPQPLILALDDLQWCDAETLAWLRYLLRFASQMQLLIVGTVRSEEAGEQHPLRDLIQQVQRVGQYKDLELVPLSLEETAVLAGHLTGENVTGWATQLYQETEGNPLFVVEMVRAGVIGRHVNVQEGQVVALPPTIQGVITARLNQLSAPARQLAQMAATIGRAFTFEVLATASRSSEELVVQALDELWQRRIVRERGQSYDFSHDKIREVTYNVISPMLRRLLHRNIGEALEGLHDHHLAEVAGELAVHFEKAGIDDKARDYYLVAGERAMTHFAYGTALAYLNHALALTPEREKLARYRLLRLQCSIPSTQSDEEAQVEVLRLMQEIAGSLPEDEEGLRCRAEVAYLDSGHLCLRGDYVNTVRSAQRAIELAQASGASDIESMAYERLGFVYWAWGEYGIARDHLLHALMLAEQTGLRAMQAYCLGMLSSCGLYGGIDTYDQTMAYLDQSLALFRQSGDLGGEALTLNDISYLIVAQGDGGYEDAEACHQQALKISQKCGYTVHEAVSLANIGLVHDCRGDYNGSVAALRQAIAITESIGDIRQQGATLDYLGYSYLNQGDYANAQEALEAAYHLLHSRNIRLWEVNALSNLGLLHHCLGEEERALAYLDQALTTVRGVGYTRQEARVLTRRGHVLIALGRLAEAASSYQQALAHHQQLQQLNRSMEPLAGLAEVASVGGNHAEALGFVGTIARHLKEHRLDCTEDTLHVYLVCFDVLHTNQDPRAQNLLEMAHEQLQARVASIDPEERRQHFWDAPSHRKVVDAMQKVTAHGR